MWGCSDYVVVYCNNVVEISTVVVAVVIIVVVMQKWLVRVMVVEKRKWYWWLNLSGVAANKNYLTVGVLASRSMR